MESAISLRGLQKIRDFLCEWRPRIEDMLDDITGELSEGESEWSEEEKIEQLDPFLLELLNEVDINLLYQHHPHSFNRAPNQIYGVRILHDGSKALYLNAENEFEFCASQQQMLPKRMQDVPASNVIYIEEILKYWPFEKLYMGLLESLEAAVEREIRKAEAELNQ